jgi:hypothetical protein
LVPRAKRWAPRISKKLLSAKTLKLTFTITNTKNKILSAIKNYEDGNTLTYARMARKDPQAHIHNNSKKSTRNINENKHKQTLINQHINSKNTIKTVAVENEKSRKI